MMCPSEPHEEIVSENNGKGSRKKQELYCRICGKPVVKSWVFCYYCGANQREYKPVQYDSTDHPDFWERPATCELVEIAVRDSIFECDIDSDYNAEHLRIVHAYCLQLAVENEDRVGDPLCVATDSEVAYYMSDILEMGISFRQGLEVGFSIASGDYDALPTVLKNCLEKV